MKTRNKTIETLPYGVVSSIVALVVADALMAVLTGVGLAAAKHNTASQLFGLTLAMQFQESCLTLVAFTIVTVLLLALLIGRYATVGRRLRQFLCLFASIVLLLICCVGVVDYAYSYDLDKRGVGTMQTGLDTGYYQDEMRVMGNLGVYGGQIISTDEAIYICRQMDTFGPFAEQILEDTSEQPFSQGYEQYTTLIQDGLEQQRALSVQHYRDGYWLVVKRFVKAGDLAVHSVALRDLEQYIVQMQYVCHRSHHTKILLEEFEEVAGEAVIRVEN